MERPRFVIAKLGAISQSQVWTNQAVEKKREQHTVQGWRTGAWDLGCVVLGVHVNCLCGQFAVFTVKNPDLPKLPVWKKRECNFHYSDL